MKVRRKKSDSMTNEMKGVVDGFQDRATHANLPKLGGQIAALFFFEGERGRRERFLQGVARGAMESIACKNIRILPWMT
jgi:hypothetical protein